MKKTEYYRMMKPSEARAIEAAIQKPQLRFSFKTALYTGMRYSELRAFAAYPEWHRHERHIIIIPGQMTKTGSERKVNLSPAFSELLYYFLQSNTLKFSSYAAWTCNIRRWARSANLAHPEDFSAGSTRKAWESWLIESGYPISRILASQGHDMNTSMKHYYNNDVTATEREEMKKETAGWG